MLSRVPSRSSALERAESVIFFAFVRDCNSDQNLFFIGVKLTFPFSPPFSLAMVSHEAYVASLPYDWSECYELVGKVLFCCVMILFMYIGDRGRSLVLRFLVSLVVLVVLRVVLVIWWWFSLSGIPHGNGFHDWCKTQMKNSCASKSSGSHSPVAGVPLVARLAGVVAFPGVVVSRLVLVVWWWFSPSGIPQGNGFHDWCKTQMENSCASMSSDPTSPVVDVRLPGVAVSSPVLPVVPVRSAFVPSLLPSSPQEQDVRSSSAPVPSLLPSEPKVPVVPSYVPSVPQVPVVPFSSASVPAISPSEPQVPVVLSSLPSSPQEQDVPFSIAPVPSSSPLCSVPVAMLSAVPNASKHIDIDGLCKYYILLEKYTL